MLVTSPPERHAPLFGTDGIRGLANRFPMTGEVAMAVGRAMAHVICTHPAAMGRSSVTVGLKPLESNRSGRRVKVVVGKDTRLSGYMIEQALSSGLCSMGADVVLIGPLSTPGVAFVTQSMRADAGIMISASHNPFEDNGIKLFSADGYKLPDAIEREIERLVFSQELAQEWPTGDRVGKASRIDDVHGRYLVFLKSLFPRDLDLLGLRVVLDCAHGAAYKVAPLVFEELGAEVFKLGVNPDGLNINHNCGALHPQQGAHQVVQYRADIGICLDGDGDRCILIDETGEILDGDQILGLCALQLKKDRVLEKDTIVATPMSNMGLERSLRAHSIQCLRAPIGDRHVVDLMRLHRLNLGGEQSGHIVFLDHATTGDGIVAALKVLEIMRRTGVQLSELKKAIELLPQITLNVPITHRRPFAEIPPIAQAIQQIENQLVDRGRLLVRYSGTQAMARVMVEGTDRAEIEGFARGLADLISEHLFSSTAMESV